mgnify:CR=1 FL=1
MRRKWNPMRIDHDFSCLSCEEYNQLLAEFAGMIYRHFCQLQIDQPLGHVTEIPAYGVERTGTNG